MTVRSSAEALLAQVVATFRESLGADVALLLRPGASGADLRLLAGDPEPSERVFARSGLEAAALAAGQPIVASDPAGDARHRPLAGTPREVALLAAVPVEEVLLAAYWSHRPPQASGSESLVGTPVRSETSVEERLPHAAEAAAVGIRAALELDALRLLRDQEQRPLIASRTALAIENARLLARERQATQELARKNEALKEKSRELIRMGRTLSQTNETLQGWLERLDQAHRNLSVLYDMNRMLSRTLDQEQVMSLALERLEWALSSHGARAGGHRLAICTLSEDRKRMFISASRGGGGRVREPVSARATLSDMLFLEPGDPVDVSSIPPLLMERILEEGEPVLVHDASAVEGLGTLLGGRDVRSIYAWPILVQGETIGLLVVASARPCALDDEAVRTVGVVAAQLAVAVGNARLYHRALLDKELLEDVIRSMGDGMITLDWEMNVLSMNAAAGEITGWKPEEVIGRNALEVFTGAGGVGYGLARSRTPLADVLGSPEISERGLVDEGTLRVRDGREIYVESIHSIFILGGVPLGGVAIFRDVTEKVGVAQAKMDYVASLSHDIRTPLAAIKGYALTLARHEESLDQATRREFLMIINAEIDRLSRLLDNLLNFSRMEVGHLVAQPSSFELRPVVKRVLDLHTLTTTKHALHLEAEDDLPAVWADSDQVEQILNNLVSNAIKYSPDGGSVDVGIHADGRGVLRITVRDHGVGIDEEALPQIFQRYRRLKDRATKDVSGTGLGLFITRNLVEAQGGTVSVRSRPGEGSEFAFTIPVAPR